MTAICTYTRYYPSTLIGGTDAYAGAHNCLFFAPGRALRIYRYRLISRFFLTGGLGGFVFLSTVDGINATGNRGSIIIADLISVRNNGPSTDVDNPTEVEHTWGEGLIVSETNGNTQYSAIGLAGPVNLAGQALFEMDIGWDHDYDNCRVDLQPFGGAGQILIDLGDNP